MDRAVTTSYDPGASGSSSRADGDGVVLRDVTMELAGTPGPATVVAGVTLSLSAGGLWIQPPEPTPAVTVGWSGLVDASCGEPGVLPDGTEARALSAVVGGRLVRWLVSAEQLTQERSTAIDLLLAARTGRPAAPVAGGTTVSSARATPLRRVLFQRAPARGLSIGILWAFVGILVVAGALVLWAGWPQPRRPSPRAGTAHGAGPVADEVRLVPADLPAGWSVSSTPAGPLSGFLHGDGFTKSAPAGTGVHSAIARTYDRCVGVGLSQSFLLGGAAALPVAHAASPAFAGPATGPPAQAASLTDVYRTKAPVERGQAELGRPRWSTCFGAAVGDEFRRSAQGSTAGSSADYGPPTVRALSLPQNGTARATGVDLTFPLQFGGTRTTVQLGFVFVTGGRVESTLVTFATASGFPASLTRSLTAALEADMATAGSAR